MDFLIDAVKFVGILLLVLLVFNVIILVHEWGHFLAARWRKLKIEKFQIWFGKPIWKKEWNGVQYGLGSIPAGGFVALPQMAPMDMIEGPTDAAVNRERLAPISPLDKIIVAFAGPLFSFLLAVVFALIVWMVGRPVDEAEGTTTIGYLFEGMPAAESELRPGDRIVAVDGAPVTRFSGMVDSVQWAVARSEGDEIIFTVERPGSDGSMDIPVVAPTREELDGQLSKSWWRRIFQRPPLRQVGIVPRTTPLVHSVLPNSPAALAGIQPHEFIVELEGRELFSPFEVNDFVKQNQGKALALTVEGKNGRRSVTVSPRVPEIPKDYQDYKIGLEWNLAGKREVVHPGPMEQISAGLQAIRNTLGAIFSKDSSIGAAHLSGPLGIIDLYYNLFQDPQGWRLVLWFSVVLNVNLALLNLLPFPVLDGGHITLAAVEAARRKPINFKILEIVQFACVMLLFGFMIFLTLKDSGKYLPGEGTAAPTPPQFLPPGGEAAGS